MILHMSSVQISDVEAPQRGDELPSYGHFIDGKSVDPASREYLLTEDPYTGKPWARIARGTREDVAAAVEGARRAFVQGP